jgi:phosphoribosylanthranilate isomerase
MFVKICGITSEEDALLAVALGANALGFVFAPSPRQMSPDAVAAIVRRLPREILTLGVFRDELPARVVETVFRSGLRGAQLHGRESATVTAAVRRELPFVVKAFMAGQDAISLAASYEMDALLLDAPSPGSGVVFDWRLAEGAPARHRLILAGGLTADNVAQAIAQVHPFGVDVSSGVESSPGRKDPRRLREFIRAARSGEQERGDTLAALESGDGFSSPYDWEAAGWT